MGAIVLAGAARLCRRGRSVVAEAAEVAERRRHDADVHVRDGLELGLVARVAPEVVLVVAVVPGELARLRARLAVHARRAEQPWIRFGTASFRIACFVAHRLGLSIAKRRSILSTACCERLRHQILRRRRGLRDRTRHYNLTGDGQTNPTAATSSGPACVLHQRVSFA